MATIDKKRPRVLRPSTPRKSKLKNVGYRFRKPRYHRASQHQHGSGRSRWTRCLPTTSTRNISFAPSGLARAVDIRRSKGHLRWWCWIFCNSFVRPRRFVRSFARILLLDWIGSGSWSSLRRVMQCVWSVPSFAAQFAAFGWPERWRSTMIDWGKIVGNKIDSFYGFIPICSVDRVRGRAVV